MHCSNCGEQNPENAIFCRNCGTRLKEDVKKAEVIDRNETNQKSGTAQTNSDSSDWIGCCLCLIGIFIIFAILGLIF